MQQRIDPCLTHPHSAFCIYLPLVPPLKEPKYGVDRPVFRSRPSRATNRRFSNGTSRATCSTCLCPATAILTTELVFRPRRPRRLCRLGSARLWSRSKDHWLSRCIAKACLACACQGPECRMRLITESHIGRLEDGKRIETLGSTLMSVSQTVGQINTTFF